MQIEELTDKRAVPAGQLLAQAAEPEAETDPAAQSTHAIAPIALWYWPAGQFEHVPAPDKE